MESPIAPAALVTTVFGYAVIQVATTSVNPAHPSFPMFLAFLGATVGASWGYLTTRTRERMQDRAFWFSFIAGWIGIVVYGGFLVANLF